MSQNGQTHFKNLAAFAARFLKCVWPFWDIMYKGLKENDTSFYIIYYYRDQFIIDFFWTSVMRSLLFKFYVLPQPDNFMQRSSERAIFALLF